MGNRKQKQKSTEFKNRQFCWYLMTKDHRIGQQIPTGKREKM